MSVTRVNYDATFCGKLPLTKINTIQPHGVLLLLSKNGFNVLQASENANAVFKISAQDIVNKPFQRLIGDASFTAFIKQCAEMKGKCFVHFSLVNSSEVFVAVLQDAGNYFLLEIEVREFLEPVENGLVQVFQKTRQVMERISRAETVQQLCRIAAEEIKALSGFDKVMIYQFDKDWNGEVIAEVMESGMDAYMGLKFPASDIPKPARDMYTTNPYRFIPNREYQPVHLYPLLNPITHSFTNLIASELRSVAGVHLEYLKNMEVTASMSTRILLNGKLWGLIACHHRTAKYLSFEQCYVFEILSELISSRITALISSDVLKRQDRLNKDLLAFVERIYPYQNIVDAVRQNKEDLMQFLSAEGLVLTWNEHIEKAGSTPGDIELDVLRYWLQGRLNGSVYHEPALPAVMDDAQTYAAQASGLLVLPLDSSRGNFILLFRPEVLKKQDWGGNPDEAIRFEKNNTVYHPRHSFDSWQEVVRNTAQPWSDDEIAAAETLKNIMVELLHRH